MLTGEKPIVFLAYLYSQKIIYKKKKMNSYDEFIIVPTPKSD